MVKNHLLLFEQACAFLNQYQQLRGECQESYYNLGRAMHQLGTLFCIFQALYLLFYFILQLSPVFLNETFAFV